ncbi:MAG: response regulator [Desulfarculus sp.]|nr:response regulator [Desulfarculus sp.]
MDKILVIDDEKPTLAMFGLLLGALGYEVITAENGHEGLATVQRERPPVVITDIKMPGMDGIEVLQAIKQIAPETEVIVITGHGDMDLAIRALNLDATDFLNKPIQRHALQQALERAWKRRDLAQNKEDQVAVRLAEQTALIDIRGNLTSHSEDALREAFDEALAAGRQTITLQFADSSSINGAGLAIMTQLLLRAKDGGRQVFITGLSENFVRVLEIAGLTRLATVTAGSA